MAPSYKLIGADGKEYGPVTAEQLQSWMREGRVGAETQVMRSDQPGWVAAGSLPEFGFSPAPSAATAPVEDIGFERAIKSGASWFYWIAALSVVNSVSALMGGSWRFIFSLGITELVDAFAAQMGTTGKSVALGLNATVAGVFVLFGVFAGKRHGWAFIAGMVLFALDGLLTALLQEWISVAFHAFALYCIFKGYQAHRAFNAYRHSATR